MHIDNWRARQFNASEKINFFSSLSTAVQDNALSIKFSQIERKSIFYLLFLLYKTCVFGKIPWWKSKWLGRPLKSGLSTAVTRSLHGHSMPATLLADLLDAPADDTSLLNLAPVQYQDGTGGSPVEKAAETQEDMSSNPLCGYARKWPSPV